jgi:D-psicose/D-tagatose/L-ribulose 3-epimerase
MPWAEIKKALDDIDYAGPLVMEPFIMKGGQIGRDIGVWRDLVENPDLDALAAQSAEFVKKTLR